MILVRFLAFWHQHFENRTLKTETQFFLQRPRDPTCPVSWPVFFQKKMFMGFERESIVEMVSKVENI